MKKKLAVNCPKCRTKFEYYESAFRPFCSERCKMVDLGHWVQEGYRLASSEPLSLDDIEQVISEHTREDED